MIETKNCCVIVPAMNAIEPLCENGLQILESRGYTVRRYLGCSPVDLARNECAYAAIRDGFEETIWIDSDIQFDPDDIERIRARDVAVCCGVYPKKGSRQLACQLLPETDIVHFGENGGLLEIKYAPAGFLYVRRDVYETIISSLKLELCNAKYSKPMFPFFQPSVVHTPSGPCYLTEDFAFSERIRQCGFTVYADTTIRLGHIGSYVYKWEDAGSELERYSSYAFRVVED